MGKKEFLNTWWINATHVQQELDWILPPIEEFSVVKELRYDADVWFSHKFTYCPRCLGSGYHSIWFQFNPLSICPIHGCKLLRTCISCGAQTPDYRASGDLLDYPYVCSACGALVAGEICSITKHLDFRKHFIERLHAFSELTNWVNQYRDSVVATSKLIRNTASNKYGISPCLADLIRSVGHHEHPLPSICDKPTYSQISKFGWKAIQWHGTENALAVGVPSLNLDSAFMEVLWDIQQWIFSELRKKPYRRRPTPDVCPEFIIRRDDSRKIDIDSWDPRELAYMLLRYEFDGFGEWGLDSSVNHAWLRESSATAYLGKQGLRSKIIGCYCGLLRSLLNERTGVIDIDSLWSNRVVVKYINYDYGTRIQEGAFFFPTVPEFPTEKLGGITMTIDKLS